MTDLPTSRIDLKAVLSGSSPTAEKDDHSEGMSYLESVPRRLVTLYLPLAIIGGVLGEGAAISNAMIPFLLAAIMISWFGLQRRKWQQGESND